MSVVGAERQMLAVVADTVFVEQTPDLVQQRFVQGCRSAQRQGKTVADETMRFRE
jgi:hypothetical protein